MISDIALMMFDIALMMPDIVLMMFDMVLMISDIALMMFDGALMILYTALFTWKARFGSNRFVSVPLYLRPIEKIGLRAIGFSKLGII